jgi:SAM-dependent methyltransferase
MSSADWYIGPVDHETCRVTGHFKDHFSSRSVGYAAFRPTYPAALFQWLGTIAPSRSLAWDCATGNGQAALGLAQVFERVIATDASEAQIRSAKAAPNVEYRVARAETSGLPDRSVDLTTVAQALHWLDRPAFYAEARRVGKAGGILAVWMYALAQIDSTIDPLVQGFYSGTVGPYWPGDRALVDQHYRTVEFPFQEIAAPPFEMSVDWTIEHMLGYLRTWSAVTRYVEARGHDPVADFGPELSASWGEGVVRRVRWPLYFRVGKL